VLAAALKGYVTPESARTLYGLTNP
jgi:hypothetical protein